jgi:hypothetical protein
VIVPTIRIARDVTIAWAVMPRFAGGLTLSRARDGDLDDDEHDDVPSTLTTRKGTLWQQPLDEKKRVPHEEGSARDYCRSSK